MGRSPVGGGDDPRKRFGVFLRDAFARSAFSSGGPAFAGGQMGFWGRGAVTRFDGGAAGFDTGGDLVTAMLGADWSRDGAVFGLMVSHGLGDGEHRLRGVDSEMELTLTGVTPYAGFEVNERVSLWAAAGSGGGELRLRRSGGGELRADLSTRMAAAGGRGELFASAAGYSLSVISDAFVSRAESDAAPGLAGGEAASSRLRLALEGAWSRALADGGRFETRLEAGVRRDGGDAEEGFGAEVAGGLAWRRGGLRFELEGRSLVAHRDGAFRQYGASAYLAWDPSPESALGPTASLRRGLGVDTGSGIDRLYRMDGLAGFGMGMDQNGGGRMELELGWGVRTPKGRFALTPTVSRGASAGGGSVGLGWRIAPLDPDDIDLEAALEAVRRERSGQVHNDLLLEIRFGW